MVTRGEEERVDEGGEESAVGLPRSRREGAEIGEAEAPQALQRFLDKAVPQKRVEESARAHAQTASSPSLSGTQGNRGKSKAADQNVTAELSLSDQSRVALAISRTASAHSSRRQPSSHSRKPPPTQATHTLDQIVPAQNLTRPTEIGARAMNNPQRTPSNSQSAVLPSSENAQTSVRGDQASVRARAGKRPGGKKQRSLKQPNEGSIAFSDEIRERDPAVGTIRSSEVLKDFILSRLFAEPRPEGFSFKMMGAFRHVILSEIDRVWDNFQRRGPDFNLTPEATQEVNRRFPWTVVELCVFLYQRIRKDIDRARVKGVFTDNENIVRFLSKLSGECRRAFNVKEICRHLALQLADTKGKPCRPLIVTEARKQLIEHSMSGHVPPFMFIQWYAIQDSRDANFHRQMNTRIKALTQGMVAPHVPFDTSMDTIKAYEAEEARMAGNTADLESSSSKVSVKYLASIGAPFANTHLLSEDADGALVHAPTGKSRSDASQGNEGRGKSKTEDDGTADDEQAGEHGDGADTMRMSGSDWALGMAHMQRPGSASALELSHSARSGPTNLQHNWHADKATGKAARTSFAVSQMLGNRDQAAIHGLEGKHRSASLHDLSQATGEDALVQAILAYSVADKQQLAVTNAPPPPPLPRKRIDDDGPHDQLGSDEGETSSDRRKSTLLNTQRAQHISEVRDLQQKLLQRRLRPEADIGELDPILCANLKTEHLLKGTMPKKRAALEPKYRNAGSKRYFAKNRSDAVKKHVDEDPLVAGDGEDDITPEPQPLRVFDRDLSWFSILDPYSPIYLETDNQMPVEVVDAMDAPVSHEMEIYDIFNELSTVYSLDSAVDDYMRTIDIIKEFSHAKEVEKRDADLEIALFPHRCEQFTVNEFLKCDEALLLPPRLTTTQKGHVAPTTKSYRNRPERVVSQNPNTKISKEARQYEAWLAWWVNTVSFEDYAEWLEDQAVDFLPAIFHVFVDASPHEQEEDAELAQAKAELEDVHKVKSAELFRQKKAFKKGLWNADTVKLGGLAADVGDLAMDAISGVKHEPERRKEFGMLQERLDRIWTTLGMSTKERLDKAIAYSDAKMRILSASRNKASALDVGSAVLMRTAHHPAAALLVHKEGDRSKSSVIGLGLHTLTQAVILWEAAAEAIEQREKLLLQLESFEREHSDPKRLLSKKVPAVRQMKVAALREALLAKLSEASTRCLAAITEIEDGFAEIVKYKQRPYKEKMKTDIREMMYWLSQERKTQQQQQQQFEQQFEQQQQQPLTISGASTSLEERTDEAYLGRKVVAKTPSPSPLLLSSSSTPTIRGNTTWSASRSQVDANASSLHQSRGSSAKATVPVAKGARSARKNETRTGGSGKASRKMKSRQKKSDDSTATAPPMIALSLAVDATRTSQ